MNGNRRFKIFAARMVLLTSAVCFTSLYFARTLCAQTLLADLGGAHHLATTSSQALAVENPAEASESPHACCHPDAAKEGSGPAPSPESKPAGDHAGLCCVTGEATTQGSLTPEVKKAVQLGLLDFITPVFLAPEVVHYARFVDRAEPDAGGGAALALHVPSTVLRI